MSYQQMHEAYDDQPTRDRAMMCIKEQGQIFSNDERVDIAALGAGVMQNRWGDIEAIWAAVTTGPNYATLSDDGSLLAAVQAVWPMVADIIYGHLIPPADPVGVQSASIDTSKATRGPGQPLGPPRPGAKPMGRPLK